MPERAAPDDRMALIDALRRFNIESDRFVEVFSTAHGLHRSDMNALAYVSAADQTGAPLGPGELGAELGLSSPATTALIDRLERAGHLTRERHPSDRRKVALRSREQGNRLAVEFFQPLGQALGQAMDEFDDEQLRIVFRFLDRAVAAVTIARQAQRDG